MSHLFRVSPLLSALLLAGCSLLAATVGPRPTAPAAGDLAERHVVARGADSVTFLPASPKGALLGIDYDYTMPHCGTGGPIDVDGSFWDIEGDGVGMDGLIGVFRLVGLNDAVFTPTGGVPVRLARHNGPKEFPFCA